VAPGHAEPAIESSMGAAKDYRCAYEFMQRAADIYAQNLRRNQDAMAYLRGRGFSDATIRAFGLGYAPRDDAIRRALCTTPDAAHKIRLAHEISLICRTDDGTYRDFLRDRIIFPIRWPDKRGKFRVVAFSGRAMREGDSAKYINSRKTFLYNKSAMVYGLNHAHTAILETSTVVLVEGYTDCIAAHQGGVRNVVAASGTAFTDESAHILSMYAKYARVVMDPDQAGQDGGAAAVDALRRAGVEATLVTLPDGLDPADFIRSRGAEALAEVVR